MLNGLQGDTNNSVENFFLQADPTLNMYYGTKKFTQYPRTEVIRKTRLFFIRLKLRFVKPLEVMITISEFSPTIYFIKSETKVSSAVLAQMEDVRKLIDEREFELKFDEHGFWILHVIAKT